jgi:hypothetical protein
MTRGARMRCEREHHFAALACTWTLADQCQSLGANIQMLQRRERLTFRQFGGLRKVLDRVRRFRTGITARIRFAIQDSLFECVGLGFGQEQLFPHAPHSVSAAMMESSYCSTQCSTGGINGLGGEHDVRVSRSQMANERLPDLLAAR